MTDSAARAARRGAPPSRSAHPACRAPSASSAPACSDRASATRSPRAASTSPSTTRLPSQLRLAVDYGAGRLARDDDEPALIVVAVPPDVTADVIERELARHPRAVVTDVASVKLEPLEALRERGVDLTHYIGSHPLAGRERGGAISARADIFVGRPWVVCRDEETSAADLALVEGLALDLGATPLEMTPEDHDRAVALVSHVPQLVASLLAGRFVDAPDGSLRLAGQGVRDTTRIAASAPELWVQILGANAAPVVDVLDALAADLSAVADALRAPEAPGSRRAVADTIRRGNDGVERLPGKHGQNRRFEQVVVMVDDTPGQLGRLFGELGELEVNVEDLRLEHSPRRAVRSRRDQRRARTPCAAPSKASKSRGWKIASTTND